MNDDELHRMRMAMGIRLMDMQDALDEDAVQAIVNAKEAVETMVQVLRDKGFDDNFIAGMMGAAILDLTR